MLKLPESPRQELILVLTSLSLGVILGVLIYLPSEIALIAISLAGVVCTAFALEAVLRNALKKIHTEPPKIRWRILALGILLIGLATGLRVGNERAEIKTLGGERIELYASVNSFPRDSGTTFAFTADAELLKANGEVLEVSFPVRLSSPNPIERGSQVVASCTLKIQGTRYSCTGGNIQTIARPSKIYETLNKIRTKAYQETLARLPQDNAALLSGMVYGGDDSLPKETRDNFRAAGLSHLIAVSGANLAVVTVLLYGFFTATFLRRKQAAIAAAATLAVTVIFVGLEASVTRAALMGFLMLLANFLGRPREGGNALLLAASLMLFLNPWLLFDIGFLLSVSATAGLMYLSKPLEEKLQFIPEFGDLRGGVTTALAAHLATLPIIALTIGNVSLTSPIVNVLAAPFAATIFLLGILWFLTLPIPFASAILAPILSLLLEGLRFLAALFAGVPGGALTSQLAIWSATGATALVIAILLRSRLSSSQPRSSPKLRN